MISTVFDPRQRRRTPRPRWHTHMLPALAAVAAGVVTITACGGSGSGGGAAGPTSGHITLVVQAIGGGGRVTTDMALDKAFEAQHPGVTIKLVTKSFTDLVSTAKLQLSGANPPDVSQVNQGYGAGDMGPLIADGLLLNLDSYAKKYNWAGRQSSDLLALDGRFSPDGKRFGSGPLYGISATGAWLGLFVNTRVARSLGIASPPATLAALEHDLAIAKAHGVVPLQFDAYESSWLLASLLLPDSPQLVGDVVGAKPGSTLQSAQFQHVAETIGTWGNKGYFPAGWPANRSSGVFGDFLRGQSLFTVDGSWELPLPSNVRAADFTMVPFPSRGGPAAPSAVATGDSAWSIPAKSKHQALAAEYIDFITSAKSATTLVSTGSVPATLPGNLNATISASHLSGPSKDAMLGWQQILAKGTPVPYIDWATPTFLTTIQAQVAELGSGKITPPAFTAALQADYGPFVKSRQ